MTSTAVRMTYEDVWALPDDGTRYELIDGELIVVPSPHEIHQLLMVRLVAWLHFFVEQHRLGVVLAAPYDVVLAIGDLVQPDILFVSNERAGIRKGGHIAGAPDLAIEIISPSSRAIDARRKFALYARHGVREYWLVDPATQTMRLFLNVDGRFEEQSIAGRLVRSVILAGFEVDLDRLFADLPPASTS